MVHWINFNARLRYSVWNSAVSFQWVPFFTDFHSRYFLAPNNWPKFNSACNSTCSQPTQNSGAAKLRRSWFLFLCIFYSALLGISNSGTQNKEKVRNDLSKLKQVLCKAIGYSMLKAQAPIRTLKQSNIGPRQYLDGRLLLVLVWISMLLRGEWTMLYQVPPLVEVCRADVRLL